MCGAGEETFCPDPDVPHPQTHILFLSAHVTLACFTVFCCHPEFRLLFRYRKATVSHLEISSVVLIPVPLCSLPQGHEDEPSEVGRAGRRQSHWWGHNISGVRNTEQEMQVE